MYQKLWLTQCYSAKADSNRRFECIHFCFYFHAKAVFPLGMGETCPHPPVLMKMLICSSRSLSIVTGIRLYGKKRVNSGLSFPLGASLSGYIEVTALSSDWWKLYLQSERRARQNIPNLSINSFESILLFAVNIFLKDMLYVNSALLEKNQI